MNKLTRPIQSVMHTARLYLQQASRVLLPRTSFARRAARALLGRIVAETPPGPIVQTLPHALAATREHVRFIQIGSNDGVRLDPLHDTVRRFRCNGILVEPLPHLHARLKETYRGIPGLIFENAAISDQESTLPFYYIPDRAKSNELPWWFDAIGSLSREHLLGLSGQIPGIEKLIEEVAVPCLTFDSLCRKHSVTQFDLLHIDAEGHDYRILRSIDFEKYRPTVVIYERHHMTHSERVECRRRMRTLGYDTLEEDLDSIALRLEAPNLPQSLKQLWRSYRFYRPHCIPAP